MRCVFSSTTDPLFNLAAEEYLFKNFGEDVFFLYINEDSVVVGKHQNALAEINPVYVYENGIKVIRRMSGGGAVYHDTGNLNFSFHKTVEDTANVSFRDFNVPVVRVLNEMGIPAVISGRNDILVNGYKVSGHAQHVFRKRVQSHGTLLIDANLEKLSMALKKGSGVYESKAIQSVRSKVANVNTFFGKHIAADEMGRILLQYIIKTEAGAQEYMLNDDDKKQILELVEKKYSTPEWIFGYSPVYRFENSVSIPGRGILTCRMDVEKGLIKSVSLGGNILSGAEVKLIETGLNNKPHYPGFVIQYFNTDRFFSVSSEILATLFF